MISMLAAAGIFTAPVPAMTADWFSPVYDWPNKGIGNELVVVEAGITVNPYGYIQDCAARVRLGIPQLGPYICERLKLRGEFDPARDAEKHRIYGVYRTSIALWGGQGKFPKYDSSDFQIAGPSAPGSDVDPFVIQFAVEANGRPNSSSCSLVTEVGYGLNRHKQVVDPSLVAEACAELPSKMTFEPARDRSGRAVASVQMATVGVLSGRA